MPYQFRTHSVEAAQYSFDGSAESRDAIAALMKLESVGLVPEGICIPIGPEKNAICKPLDWVVKYPDGAVQVIPPEIFRALYEEKSTTE